MNIDALAKNTLEKVKFTDKYRGRLLKPHMLVPLAEMAEAVCRIDSTQYNSLLSEIGSELAELIDQKFILNALVKHFQAQQCMDEPYSQLMQKLIESTSGSDQAFNKIVMNNALLQQAITAEIKSFVANINLMAQRITQDINKISEEFSTRWGNETPRPSGIIKAEIAGRSSFNGGKRIIILTLDNHKKLVYKPRDIRIEAKLIGHIGCQCDNINSSDDTNRSFVEIVNTLLREELGDNFTPIPTYQFFTSYDKHGHYGYAEYLSCGTETDAYLTHEQAQRLYRQLGQLTGIALLLGLYDLLPSNVRISGKQAYFTDSDIAFEQGLLRIFFEEIANKRPITIPPVSLQRSLLTNFWQHSLNTVKPTTLYTVKKDRIIKNPRLTSRNNTKIVATENFILVENKGSNRNLNSNKDPKNIHTLYASDVKQGLQNIFLIIGKNKQASQRIKSFITDLAGLQVRYFPFLVLSPVLQKIFTDYISDYPDPDQFLKKLNREVGRILQKNYQDDTKYFPVNGPNTIALQEAICDSLINGDYFYVTQKLGENKLYYRDRPIVINDDAKHIDERESFFPNCSLQMAIKIIDQLEQDSTQQQTRLFCDHYESYIQSLVMPSPPPKYALVRFIETIGSSFAEQLHKINDA